MHSHTSPEPAGLRKALTSRRALLVLIGIPALAAALAFSMPAMAAPAAAPQTVATQVTPTPPARAPARAATTFTMRHFDSAAAYNAAVAGAKAHYERDYGTHRGYIAGGTTTCWHIYHYGIIWMTKAPGVPNTNMGVLHFAADVCADGYTVWLNYGGSTSGCWTSRGLLGDANWAGCGFYRDINGDYVLYGQMNTHATLNVPVGPSPNVDSYEQMWDVVHTWNTFDDGANGSTNVWWGQFVTDGSPYIPD